MNTNLHKLVDAIQAATDAGHDCGITIDNKYLKVIHRTTEDEYKFLRKSGDYPAIDDFYTEAIAYFENLERLTWTGDGYKLVAIDSLYNIRPRFNYDHLFILRYGFLRNGKNTQH